MVIQNGQKNYNQPLSQPILKQRSQPVTHHSIGIHTIRGITIRDLQFVTLQFVTLTIRDITIRDMSINLKIDIIVLNLSYFMLCDDCQIATYVYILWDYLYNDDR